MPGPWGTGMGRQKQAHVPFHTRCCGVGTRVWGCRSDPTALGLWLPVLARQGEALPARPGSSPAQESANPPGRRDHAGSQDSWLQFR